jgi:hypothetical protein
MTTIAIYGTDVALENNPEFVRDRIKMRRRSLRLSRLAHWTTSYMTASLIDYTQKNQKL